MKLRSQQTGMPKKDIMPSKPSQKAKAGTSSTTARSKPSIKPPKRQSKKVQPLKHSPSNSGASAAMQVFDTYELLEMILYELPTRDVVFAQKVSKQFKSVIENSTKLQRALFFRSISGGTLESESTTFTKDRGTATSRF